MCKAGMKRRSQKLEILLDIQTVRSPDAWLPCNGAVYLSVCLLGQYIRTKDKAPIFPIVFSETFLVEKVFGHVFRLADLDDLLDAEVVYLELIQRPPAGPDTVLASFETSARELLFPRAARAAQPRAAADLDLVMEPTAHFVGSEPPRLEVATKTTVKEVRTSLPPRIASRAGSAAARAAAATDRAAPATARAAAATDRAPLAVPVLMRGRRPGDRPPFRWRRPEAGLIGRELGEPPPAPRRRRRSRSDPPAGTGRGRHCHCSCAGRPPPPPARSASSAERAAPSSSGGRPVRSRSVEPLPVEVDEGGPARAGWCAHCRTHHVLHHCSVCEAYQRYFGRGYPGHYHHDCCDCHCPVTTEGVRHVCGKPRSQSDVTDSEMTSQESGCLAQTWQEIVQASSPPRRDKRHQFYGDLEDVYRTMYARASRRAVRGLLSAEQL